MNKTFVVGVAGGSASGKTTIVNKISEYFGSDIVVISHDSYYKSHNEMEFSERCKLNYDHPESFETEEMANDVRKLIKGQSIHMPIYDYAKYSVKCIFFYILSKYPHCLKLPSADNQQGNKNLSPTTKRN